MLVTYLVAVAIILRSILILCEFAQFSYKLKAHKYLFHTSMLKTTRCSGRLKSRFPSGHSETKQIELVRDGSRLQTKVLFRQRRSNNIYRCCIVTLPSPSPPRSPPLLIVSPIAAGRPTDRPAQTAICAAKARWREKQQAPADGSAGVSQLAWR